MKNRYKKSVSKVVAMLAVLTTLLAVGCIKNDVPYEIILGDVTKMDVRGSESLTIDNANLVIDLVLADTVDLRRVYMKDFNVTSDARIKNDVTGEVMDTLDSYYLDLTQGGGAANYFIPNPEDNPYTFTVMTYQNYVWTLKSKQNIERTFTLAGGVQIGEALFNGTGYSVTARVPLEVSLDDIKIEKLQLGPSNATLAWVSPSGDVVENVDYKTIHSFEKDQHFIVKFFDITQNWIVKVEQWAQSVTNLSVDPWAKFAHLTAEGLTSAGTAGFEVREVGAGDDAWVAVADVTVVGGKFSATAKSLTSATDYEVRGLIDKGSGDVSYGDVVTFKTETAEVVPNLNFDLWTLEGKNWYPNAVAANTYWATGNEGVTIGLAGNNDSNSIPVEGAEAVAGKAAKLTTIGVSLVEIAAGNLYTGTYKTEALNPPLSAVMGRPYTGRPTSLKGWYKYNPELIKDEGVGSFGAKKYPEEVGKPDHFSIYIRLENWGGATIRPGSKGNLGTSASTIIQIASAILEDDQEVAKYEQFNLKLDYHDTQTKPTHIVIVSSSSRYGEDFCGGIGSVLYVDEFELGFDFE